MMTEHKWASRTLRFGLALVLAYAGAASLVDPSAWVGFIPPWMSSIIDPSIFLFGFAIFELLLALWLLSGWATFPAAILMALVMFGIVFNNINALEIVFRDIAIGFGAVALAILYSPDPTVDHHDRT